MGCSCFLHGCLNRQARLHDAGTQTGWIWLLEGGVLPRIVWISGWSRGKPGKQCIWIRFGSMYIHLQQNAVARVFVVCLRLVISILQLTADPCRRQQAGAIANAVSIWPVAMAGVRFQEFDKNGNGHLASWSKPVLWTVEFKCCKVTLHESSYAELQELNSEMNRNKERIMRHSSNKTVEIKVLHGSPILLLYFHHGTF